MTDETESFVRSGPVNDLACGALVSTGRRRYRCPFVPNGARTAIGCNPDHTRVLIAEYRLMEAIENAHRSGLSAMGGWQPKQATSSHVDMLSVNEAQRAAGRPGLPRGTYRPEHRASVQNIFYGADSDGRPRRPTKPRHRHSIITTEGKPGHTAARPRCLRLLRMEPESPSGMELRYYDDHDPWRMVCEFRKKPTVCSTIRSR